MNAIKTSYDPKPVPSRNFDWSATFDSYEPGCPIGYGRTEQEAIEALKEDAELSER